MSPTTPSRAALAASLVLASFSFDPVPCQAPPARPDRAPADAQARLVLELQAQAERQFVAVPGDREFSGRMIARPLQRATLAAAGLGDAAVPGRRSLAAACR